MLGWQSWGPGFESPWLHIHFHFSYSIYEVNLLGTRLCHSHSLSSKSWDYWSAGDSTSPNILAMLDFHWNYLKCTQYCILISVYLPISRKRYKWRHHEVFINDDLAYMLTQFWRNYYEVKTWLIVFLIRKRWVITGERTAYYCSLVVIVQDDWRVVWWLVI